jgi:hypothetical protein
MISQRWGFGGLIAGRGNEREAKPSTVFVASTQESIDEGWLLKALGFAEGRLKEAEVRADFLPWNVAFKSGEMTAEALIGLSATVGAAIVVMAGDDDVKSRGDEKSAPRDNLVFEAGLLLSNLGFDQVFILREEGSKIPTDMYGVNLPSFDRPSGGGSPSEVAIQNLGNQICEFVTDVMGDGEDGSDSSVNRAIGRSLDKTEREVVEVRNAIHGRTRPKNPIEMPDAAKAYVDGVNEVRGTFLTTTYLDSAFWTMRQVPVIEANEKLVERLKEANGTARRLILLSQPVKDELRAQLARRRGLRSQEPKLVEQLDKEFNAFTKANMKLVESGFDVRVVHDNEDLWRDLPDEMPFSAGDTELAVFDEDRIDIYSGFVKLGLPAARVFGETTHGGFKAIYGKTVSYMDELWERGQDFATFSQELEEIVFDSQFEIDYELNWLLKYDGDADAGDAALKRAEMQFVRGALEARSEGGKSGLTRHLDLGTCTGRYLADLRPFIDASGVSVGIDLDRDCLEHCERKHAELLDGRTFRIDSGDLRKRDSLPRESFELVTCMMGTLCHLRREANGGSPYKDPWQAGLDNIADHLSMSGDAFVAIWNAEKEAGDGGSLLSIYPKRSTEILLRQSPSEEEFNARLRQANLRSIASSPIGDERLRVHHLQRV